MNFSILLSSRARVSLLAETITTAINLAEHPNQIEILCAADHDDPATIDYLSSPELPSQVKPFFFPRTNSLTANFNSLAHQAQSPYLFIFNDDSILTTPHWDSIALLALSHSPHPDGFIYAKTHCNSLDHSTQCGDYSSFPILGKLGVQKLGFVFFPQFPSWGADSSIHRFYQSIHRVINTNVHLNHLLHSSPTHISNPDATSKEMQQSQPPPSDANSFPIMPHVLLTKTFFLNQ